jgi:hypothetical protein
MAKNFQVRMDQLRDVEGSKAGGVASGVVRRSKQQLAEGTMRGLFHVRGFIAEAIAFLGTDTDLAVAVKLVRVQKTVQWRR